MADALKDIASRVKPSSGEEASTEGSGQPSAPTNGVASPASAADASVRPLLKQPAAPIYPEAKFELEDRHIDEPRSLRVVVVGAGLTGVTAGVLLPAKVPGIKLTIFEKNADVVSDNRSPYLRRGLTNDANTIMIGRDMV